MVKQACCRRLIMTVFTLAVLFASACYRQAPSFPQFTGRQEPVSGQPSQKEPADEPDADKGLPRLELAVPFSQEAAEALGLLFTARQNGELPLDRSALVGDKLELANLAHLSGQLELVVEVVAADSGISARQLAVYQAAGNLPDIFYCSALALRPGLDQVRPLDDLLYANQLLLPQHFPAAALDNLRQAGRLLAVPFLASTELLVHKEQLLAKNQLPLPPAEWTWAEWAAWQDKVWQKLAAQTAGADDEKTSVELATPEVQQAENGLIYQDLASFMPFMSASLSSSAGWAMWDGHTFALDSPAWQSAAVYLRKLQKNIPVPEIAAGESRPGKQPEIIGHLLDSADLASQPGYTASLMPAGSLLEQVGSDNQPRRLPVRLRCLAVAGTAREAQLAADLAAFIALDPDALLLQNRFGQYTGLFPLVQDELVWQELMAEQPLYWPIREKLSYIYLGGHQMEAGWKQLLDQVLVPGAAEYLAAAGPEQDEVLARIRAELSRLRNEGG